MNDTTATAPSLSDMREHPQIKGKMISGTSKDMKPSYLVFARNGAMGLSLRIEGAEQGARYGKSGTTYLPIRVRSSSVEQLFAEEDAKNGISHFPTTPTKAWPNIEFPTVRGNDSASTIIGKFLPGTLQTDENLFQTELTDKKLAKEIVKYLQELAGPDNLIIHHRVLQDYLHAIYTELFTAVEKSYGIHKDMIKAAEAEDVGVFGNMAAKMKKKHDEILKSHLNASDIEDNDELDDDTDEGADDNGDDSED